MTELEITSIYDYDKIPVNKAIIERLDVARKYYIIVEDKDKAKDGWRYFTIYKRPNVVPDAVPKVAKNIVFLCYKNIYFITSIRIKDDTICSDVYTPNEVIITRELLKYMFNSIDGLKIKIIKQYCELDFEPKSKTFQDALECDLEYR